MNQQTMTMEHQVYLTQLRDGIAMRVIGHMLAVNIELAIRGEQPMDDDELCIDAWNLADKMIRARLRKYGPIPAKDIMEGKDAETATENDTETGP